LIVVCLLWTPLVTHTRSVPVVEQRRKDSECEFTVAEPQSSTRFQLHSVCWTITCASGAGRRHICCCLSLRCIYIYLYAVCRFSYFLRVLSLTELFVTCWQRVSKLWHDRSTLVVWETWRSAREVQANARSVAVK